MTHGTNPGRSPQLILQKLDNIQIIRIITKIEKYKNGKRANEARLKNYVFQAINDYGIAIPKYSFLSSINHSIL